LKNKKNKEKETNIEDYYDLKVDKVDELVAALKDDGGAEKKAEGEEISFDVEECTGVSEGMATGKKKKSKNFDPYKIDKLSRVPAWLKAIFIKFWFNGCVCYFIMMGIGLTDLDAIALMGVVLGLIVDVMVNPIFRFMESDEKEYDAFMMFPFPFKAFWTFFANVAYYVVVLFVVNYFYLGVNSLVNLISGTDSSYYLGVEPLLFGVFCLIVDMVFIGIKDLIVFLVKRSKKKKAEALAGAENVAENAESAAFANGDKEDDFADCDDVERLRRLAERQNEETAKTGGAHKSKKGATSKNDRRK